MEYLDPVANLLTSTVLTAPDPATTGTTLVVQVADADIFLDPATVGEYNLVVHPAGYEPTRANAEIVRVTAKSSNSLTITRAQESTTARTIIVGDTVAMNITAKMMNDIDAELVTTNAAIPTDFDDLSDGTTNKAYTSTEKTKLSNIAESANAYTHPNHSGDVTSVADGATTIADSVVTNAKMADMTTKTYKGRTSATTGAPEDVAVATLKTDLSLVKGDVGLGNVDNTSDATKNTAEVTLTNKTLTSPVLNIGVSGTAIKDEDNMASDSATHLATQQSIKAYADAMKFNYRDDWATATAYTLKDVVNNVGNLYMCILAHTSGSAADEPGVGVDWEDYWKHVGVESISSSTPTNLTGYLYGDGSNVGIQDASNNKNHIINGNFDVWQRGTTFAAVSHLDVTADRWKFGQLAGSSAFTVSRSTDVPNDKSQYSLKFLCTTAAASPAARDETHIRYAVEGYDLVPLLEKTVTLSFWVKSSLTGTYSVAFVTTSETKSYVDEYTINTADTWEKKTITLTIDPTDVTWNTTTGFGLKLRFALRIGTTHASSTTGSWVSGNKVASSNQVNLAATVDNEFYLSQVQLNEGEEALPFIPKRFSEELTLCLRYYEKSYKYDIDPGTNTYDGLFWSPTSGNRTLPIRFVIPKRSAPTLTFNGRAGTTPGQWSIDFVGPSNVSGTNITEHQFRAESATAITDNTSWFVGHWWADAEL